MIASKQGGSLNIDVNGKMFQTSLTDKVSANVFNEKQEIEITSTVISQSYVCILLFEINPPQTNDLNI